MYQAWQWRYRSWGYFCNGNGPPGTWCATRHTPHALTMASCRKNRSKPMIFRVIKLGFPFLWGRKWLMTGEGARAVQPLRMPKMAQKFVVWVNCDLIKSQIWNQHVLGMIPKNEHHLLLFGTQINPWSPDVRIVGWHQSLQGIAQLQHGRSVQGRFLGPPRLWDGTIG